jgi:hypothetical protein
VSSVVVHASWQEPPDEVDDVLEEVNDVLPPGTTQVVRQLADDELHFIMQVVTAEVTVVVSGVIAVGVCATATRATNITEENTADTANTIAMRRIIASQVACHTVCNG